METITTTYIGTPRMTMRSYRACNRFWYAARVLFSAFFLLLGFAGRSWFLGCIGVAYFAGVELWVRRQLRPYLKGPRTWTITITEGEYRTQGGDRATMRTWTTFTRVYRRRDFWVLKLSPAMAMAFPVAVLDEVQTERFTALMKSKGLLRR